MVSTKRRKAVEQLLAELDRHKIPYIIQSLIDVDGYSIMTFDEEDNPFVSIVIHNFSYGNDHELFETAVLDDEGKVSREIDLTGWQTVEEVIDTIQAAR